VSDAQTGVEARLRGLLSRGEQAAERSLGALRGRLEAYIEKPPKEKPPKGRKRPARRRHARSKHSRK
jgi:hypothetical protein